MDEIQEIMKKCAYLITEDYAKKILQARKKTLDYEYKQIDKVGHEKCKTRGYVSHIYPLQTYKNGVLSKRILLEWSGKKAVVVFWNQMAKKAEELNEGDLIEITDVYLKQGELNLGYKGKLRFISKRFNDDFSKIKENEFTNIKGTVVEKHEDYIYKNGKIKSFSLVDGKHRIRCITFYEHFFKQIEGLEIYDEIGLENILFKNGEARLIKNSKIIILKKHLKNEIMGEIVDISPEKIQIGDYVLQIGKEQIHRLLGTQDKMGEDISLETLLKLKQIQGTLFVKTIVENKEIKEILEIRKI